MFKYATSHLRHPTRRILAFFAVENNGASIVRLHLLPTGRGNPCFPVITAHLRVCEQRTCRESFSNRSPRVKLLNGERRCRETELFAISGDVSVADMWSGSVFILLLRRCERVKVTKFQIDLQLIESCFRRNVNKFESKLVAFNWLIEGRYEFHIRVTGSERRDVVVYLAPSNRVSEKEYRARQNGGRGGLLIGVYCGGKEGRDFYALFG